MTEITVRATITISKLITINRNYYPDGMSSVDIIEKEKKCIEADPINYLSGEGYSIDEYEVNIEEVII